MTVVESRGIVRSTLLTAVPGLVHGFTTRDLGSLAGSEYPRDVQERGRRELEGTIGMRIVRAAQVHGADVAIVERDRVTRVQDGSWRTLERAGEVEADALITRERGLALAVAVADCVPVLVVTPDGWIGIAHAGWEGTTRNVVGALIRALVTSGAAPGDWRVAIGPSIGPCCYDIDASRAAVVGERLGRRAQRFLYSRGERYAFDLWLAIQLQLHDGGLRVVDSMDRCTKHEVGRFFSHRGEGGRAGRGLALIGWLT